MSSNSSIMIFIPAYWNLNPWTDLNWPLIRKLIKSRAKSHQGHKRNDSSLERVEENLRTLEAYKRGVKRGLKGEKLRLHTIAEASLHPNTENRQINRNRKDAEKFLGKAK